jgi:hypothetical protein
MIGFKLESFVKLTVVLLEVIFELLVVELDVEFAVPLLTELL